MITAYDSLKVGDRVILEHGGFRSQRSVIEVHKVTGTQIHAGNYRFRKKTGRKVGDSDWRSPSISVPIAGEIQEVMDENEKKDLVSFLRNMDWSKVDLENLREIRYRFPINH